MPEHEDITGVGHLHESKATLYDSSGNVIIASDGTEMFIKEQSAAAADRAGWGQLYVKDDAPNTLYFVDDAGNEHDLTAAASYADASGVNTGTSTTTAITPDALAGSNLGTFVVALQVGATGTNLATGDLQQYFHVPAAMNGMDLVSVHAEVITAPTGAAISIQVRNVTDAADMLSTALTIDATETGSDTAATAAVINTATDDVATNDVIAIDIDQVGSTEPGENLVVTLEFRLP